MGRLQVWTGMALAAIASLPPAAGAQTPEPFYKDRTIDLVIGYPPGGSNDLYARAVARFMGRHIPGGARVIARNMPGAGSLAAANFMANSAPRDGSTLAMISQAAPLHARLQAATIKFDPTKLIWIGRISSSTSVTMVWHTTRWQRFEDALANEITLGATGAGSTVTTHPVVMNGILGTRFKIIQGYKGSADAMLAMERGEVEGHSTSYEAVKSVHPEWISSGKVRVIVQHALKRHPELPDVRTSVELAMGEESVAIMRAIMSAGDVGKPILTAPGVPADRVEALRRAFDQTMTDPEYRKALADIRGEYDPATGAELQRIVEEVYNMPAALAEKVRAVYGDGGGG